MFGKKKTVEQQCKESKREINHGARGMEREVSKLDRQEKEMMAEIKRLAAKGDVAGAKVIGKQVVQLRDQKKRMMTMKTHMTGMASKTTTMAAQSKQLEMMKKTTGIMSQVNANINVGEVNKIMQQFALQNHQMNVTEDMMDQALDGLDDMDDLDDETENVMGQIIDEVCGDIKSAKVASNTLPSQSSASKNKISDSDLAELMAL
eukprot:TRINITY_DN380_c2_g1_i1.p1 TRINITY_DN380_c2_g1~~TRINITY_DN380_c2_g1_i1.p1  ORF type:complete len:205 (+),score=50.84 TRINITY_DN380_c2_g1_i1:54-668(+)